MASERILFLANGHPALSTGGVEVFSHDLFQAVKQAGAAALFVAAVAPADREAKSGTEFQAAGAAADEILLAAGAFDGFHLCRGDGLALTPDLAALIGAFQPTVVHFQHVLGIGIESLFLLRRMLPQAALVMTLHDYVPICANDGLMVRRDSDELCAGASADACHRCFPEIHQSRFVLRRAHLLRHLGLCDGLIVPSRFALERYAAFGIEPSRLYHIPNARPSATQDGETGTEPPRRFGLFGNLAPQKGVLVALEAANRLAEDGDVDFELSLHGSMRHQPAGFQDSVRAAIAASRGHVRMAGGYSSEEVAARMAGVDWVIAPSTWWENAPLVVLEAFRHGRPPIVSGIGGLAEQVRHDVDGLHVRPHDAAGLARAMRRAVTEAGLWQRLRANRPELPTMADVAARHLALYQALRPVRRAAA